MYKVLFLIIQENQNMIKLYVTVSLTIIIYCSKELRVLLEKQIEI